MTSRKSSAKPKPVTDTLNARHFYGRQKGRPLNPSRREALETLLPTLSVPESTLTAQADLDPAWLFKHEYPDYTLEIGFGSGEHLAGLMDQNPDTGFIGAEPFINGMSAFLKSVKDNHDNVRVLMDDAMQIVRSLKNECLEHLYILNPDPWPKKRHHKRRIVNPQTLDEFARILKPGGQLIMSTDVPDLADWMVTHSFNHPAFIWTAGAATDWKNPFENWVHTRYETKGAKGAVQMTYLIFEKTLAKNTQ